MNYDDYGSLYSPLPIPLVLTYFLIVYMMFSVLASPFGKMPFRKTKIAYSYLLHIMSSFMSFNRLKKMSSFIVHVVHEGLRVGSISDGGW